MGTRIYEARKAAGFKNAETFAVQLGVGVRTVQRWETRGTENITRLNQIAAATNMPLSYFLNGKVAA